MPAGEGEHAASVLLESDGNNPQCFGGIVAVEE